VINTTTLTDLVRHMEWADATVWTAVLACPQAHADAKRHPYLYHLHVVQRALLRGLRGEPHEAPYPICGDRQGLMPWEVDDA
jgi:hypothetical protein